MGFDADASSLLASTFELKWWSTEVHARKASYVQINVEEQVYLENRRDRYSTDEEMWLESKEEREWLFPISIFDWFVETPKTIVWRAYSLRRTWLSKFPFLLTAMQQHRRFDVVSACMWNEAVVRQQRSILPFHQCERSETLVFSLCYGITIGVLFFLSRRLRIVPANAFLINNYDRCWKVIRLDSAQKTLSMARVCAIIRTLFKWFRLDASDRSEAFILENNSFEIE